MIVDSYHIVIFLLSLLVLLELIGLIFDIKRNKKPFVKELAQKTEEIEQAKNLVRVLCHDLSNNLTVIVGTSNRACKNKNLTAEQNSQMWERIRRAAVMQKELVDHVRLIQIMQAGKMRLSLVPVSLLDTFDKIFFLFETSLKDKEIEVKVLWKNQDPSIKVLAEPVSLLNNVFSNLISNAIKFSNEKTTIFVQIETKENEMVAVSVKDQGVGMPESIKADLFYMDRVTSRAGTRGEVGNGFGMPLVLAYMKQYGGKMEIFSKELASSSDGDHGTTVTLLFHKHR